MMHGSQEIEVRSDYLLSPWLDHCMSAPSHVTAKSQIKEHNVKVIFQTLATCPVKISELARNLL